MTTRPATDDMRDARGARAWYARPLPQLQVLLVTAIVLGGGGVAYGLHNGALQLLALLVLALNPAAVRAFAANGPRALVALTGVTVLLPLLHLVPLPPAVWQALPGRVPVAESLALAGAPSGTWFPVSIDRMRTVVAFAGLIVPATLVVVGSSLRSGERLALAHTLVAAALLAFLLGAVQLSSGNSVLMLYPIRPDPDVLYGTFANRNSAGLLFVIALTLICASPRPAAPQWLVAAGSAGLLLALGTVLTQSRSAIALLVLPAALLALRLLTARAALAGRWRQVALAALAVVLTGTAVLAAGDGGRTRDSLDRFAVFETDRLEMWDDALFTAGVYFPVGSGMGTFDEVFQVHESLEYVSPRKAGRAHQDYLELAIEGGVSALLIAAAWIAWAAVASLAGGGDGGGGGGRMLRLGAGTAAASIALQSLLDYPLRNQALLAVAAVLVLLLASARKEARA